ncbi:MAG: SecY-interacting protein Syd [Pseudomonadota bacterium]
MNNPPVPVTAALTNAIDTFFAHYQQSYPELVTTFDKDWPSPCEIGTAVTDPDGAQSIPWQPVRREPNNDFAHLEKALEMAIHPDIKTHYGAYWSANLEAEAPDGHVSLLYLWSRQDVDRLIENLIGHAVACRHNKTPFSVFFACTEPDSELFLTVNNDTGCVQVEEPGRKPIGTVCDSLAEFYELLVPAPPNPIQAL